MTRYYDEHRDRPRRITDPDPEEAPFEDVSLTEQVAQIREAVSDLVAVATDTPLPKSPSLAIAWTMGRTAERNYQERCRVDADKPHVPEPVNPFEE